MEIMCISLLDDNADHNNDHSLAFFFHIISCRDDAYELTHSFIYDIGFHIYAHILINLNTYSNKGLIFHI